MNFTEKYLQAHELEVGHRIKIWWAPYWAEITSITRYRGPLGTGVVHSIVGLRTELGKPSSMSIGANFYDLVKIPDKIG